MTKEKLAEIRKRARTTFPWDFVHHVDRYWRMRVDIDELVAEVGRLQKGDECAEETSEKHEPSEAQRALAFVQNFSIG